jgi:hypothetical protein
MMEALAKDCDLQRDMLLSAVGKASSAEKLAFLPTFSFLFEHFSQCDVARAA